MKLISITFFLLSCALFEFSLAQLISQQELLGTEVEGRYRYICGSNPYRFYSEFPCNMYPVCINGGFKINVGCNQDYQCTPYSSNAVCVNNCCCTVPRIVNQDFVTTTRRFLDSAVNTMPLYLTSIVIAILLF
ncbi:unnamed protein product [Caenorhabditis brenneri]